MTAAEVILRELASGPKFTRHLAVAAGITASGVGKVCKCLQNKCLIHSAEGVHGLTAKGAELLELSPNAYPCTGKGHAPGSRGRHLRQRAWNAMRMMTTFDVQRLLSLLCDGGELTPENNLSNYCKALCKSGHLGQTPRTGSYFLKGNSGPLSPAYNRGEKTVTDRNTGEVIDIAGGSNA